MNRFAYILALILFAWTGNAQTPQLNALKYAGYKSRLANEFLIGVGDGTGMSLPASIRDTVAQKLKWGDTTIDLGMYLGVLASEFMVNHLKGLGQQAVIEELFYALQALNRLDYHAENYFGGTPSLNGFFIRDDITTDSLNMPLVLAHLNQPNATGQVTTLLSDLMDPDPTLKEESLDQVIHLLAGLALVERYIPDTVEYSVNGQPQQFMDFETSLWQEARNIANRLVSYMKEGDLVTVGLFPPHPFLLGITGLAWDFKIKNPVTGILVARGPDATDLAAGFAAAKYWITGMGSPTTNTLASQWALTTFLFFETLILPNDQDFKVMMLNALGNVWPGGLQTNGSNFQYNAQKLGPRAQSQSYEYIPLWHQSLFGTANKLMDAVASTHPYHNNPMGFYESLLNAAPAGGAYNYGGGAFPTYEWSSTSRHVHPLRRGDLTPHFPGHYNGLDYMLLYNLHYINTTLSIGFEPMSGGTNVLILAPNPSGGSFMLQHVPFSCLTYACVIYDAQGRRVQSWTQASPDEPVATADFGAGLYLLQVEGCGRRAHAKLVIY